MKRCRAQLEANHLTQQAIVACFLLRPSRIFRACTLRDQCKTWVRRVDKPQVARQVIATVAKSSHRMARASETRAVGSLGRRLGGSASLAKKPDLPTPNENQADKTFGNSHDLGGHNEP